MKLVLPLLAGAMLLTACVQAPYEQIPPTVIRSQPIERPPLNLPEVDELSPREVQWMVVTPGNVDQIFADLIARGQAPALFGVNEQGYRNIAVNTQESLRVILQQQAVIEGYREYYVLINSRIRAHNESVSN